MVIGQTEDRNGLRYTEVDSDVDGDREISIYAVGIPTQNGGIFLGHRARTTYRRPIYRGGQVVRHQDEKLEVRLNGDGMSKAKRKLNREIARRMDFAKKRDPMGSYAQPPIPPKLGSR